MTDRWQNLSRDTYLNSVQAATKPPNNQTFCFNGIDYKSAA